MRRQLLWAGVCAAALAPLGRAQMVKVEAEKPFLPEGQPLAGLVVVLDPGAGGPDTGTAADAAHGVESDLRPADLNLLVAGELNHYLHRAGATVHFTRWDDRSVVVGSVEAGADDAARARVAARTHAHLLISIRCGEAQHDKVSGVVVVTAEPGDSGAGLEGALAERLGTAVEQRVPHGAGWRHEQGKRPLLSECVAASVIVDPGALGDAEFDRWAGRRGAHREVARGVYEGVARLWGEHRAELEARRAAAGSQSKGVQWTEPVETQPARTKEEATTKTTRIARSLWLAEQPPQKPSDAEWLVQQYFRRMLTDQTFFYARVRAEQDGTALVLRGAANDARLKEMATRVLAAVGCENVRNEMEVLPSAKLGEKRFGVVGMPMALTWPEPREGLAAQTQLLLGEPVWLLDETGDGGFLLVHAGDGYVGWVRQDAVVRMEAVAFGEWLKAKTVTLTQDYVWKGFRLPTGAVLRMEALGPESVRVRLPEGVAAWGGEAVVEVPRANVRLPELIAPGQRAAENALEFLTTPYVFGARTRLGLDCSGLTGVAYATVGVALPRDARQQIIVGRMVGTAWYRGALLPGDLVFFCDDSGNVFHTGVSLGGQRFVHSSPPEVQVSSFEPADPLYNEQWAKAFMFARRPMP
jgi:N-acetylmuramoyl-L-alanine amidase